VIWGLFVRLDHREAGSVQEPLTPFEKQNFLMKGGEVMARTVMIAGLIAALVLIVGGPGLSILPAGAAEMMEADKAMMKATGEDLMAVKKELAAIQAELEKLTKRTGSMMKMMEKATTNYCKSVPDALRAAGWVPGLCK
jgi:hypothetical protein